MKSVFEFYDYRKYMREFYEERKRVSAFSWREFSRLAGFSSPNYMKVVCDGKSRLSKAGVDRVATAMELVDYEREYFTLLVDYAETLDEGKKKLALARIRELSREYRVKMLDGDSYAYFESWLNPVMRELAPMNPGAKPLALARMCYPEASATEVRESLDFMVHAGILEKKGEYEYAQAEKIVSGSSEIMPLAIRSMHRQMAKFAGEALDLIPVSRRHITGVTLSVTKAEYARIVMELEHFRQKILNIARGVKRGEQVYRLNLQFFPLTKPKEELHE
ncbi:MAG: TIGR02147 family protein [Fibrobacter sp.]|nr:TIGR02147 family protein [Fibrobacter sp.]